MLRCVEDSGLRLIEGGPDEPVVASARDTARIVEACLSERVRSALLYPANLPPAFFDLSSGQAGEILQKLRSFQIRLAIVCAPGTVRFSSRFLEIVARDFRVFETRSAAIEWLTADVTR